MGLESDWISAICSIVAALVSLLTLLGVYLAAIQILSRRQLYRLGISGRSLGPWETKVVTPSLLGMQTQISTPTLSLPRLVKKKWQPDITFPIGFNDSSTKTDPDLEVLPILAETSWVNFLQGLGMTPNNGEFYEMQYEPELVNGMVPMRWKGRDLVGLCAMLGFQSHEDKPSFKTPMPLPMQWSGPFGWLQFRASSDGCIVEYRRRRLFKNQLSDGIHTAYSGEKQRRLCLESRLWMSISGLYLPDNELLYLGGADLYPTGLDNNLPRTIDEICDHVIASDSTDEEIRRMVWGTVSPKAIQKGLSQATQSSQSQRQLEPRDPTGPPANDPSTMQVMRVCPGLLSVIVEGELTNIRGLDHKKCHEWDRRYTNEDEVNQTTHPYRLGRFCVGMELLQLLKKALLHLEPDGFYFTPTRHLYSDLNQVWKHIDNHSESRKDIFPKNAIKDWHSGVGWDTTKPNNTAIYNAICLCNEFQDILIAGRAIFTISDMGVLCKASMSLRKILASHRNGKDLVWAIIASPKLFSDLAQRFKQMKVGEMLNSEIKSETIEQNAFGAAQKKKETVIDCTGLPGKGLDLDGKYIIPLMGDGTFSGDLVLAAFLDVYLTYFWIDKPWISDVAVYDATIPQSVTMC